MSLLYAAVQRTLLKCAVTEVVLFSV